jgi:hypothetical protein
MMKRQTTVESGAQVVVVENWFTELKRLAPARK